MQDVIGFVKLVHRLAGAQVVVRGAPGHVESSLPGAAHAQLPASGDVTIAGQAYVVRSFLEAASAANCSTCGCSAAAEGVGASDPDRYRIERLLSSIALPASRAVTKFGPVGRTSPWAGKRP